MQMINADIRTGQRGFTLVELLVVIAILGILGALATGSLRGSREKAIDVQSLAMLRQIAALIEQVAVSDAFGRYTAISAPVGSSADDDSWALMLASLPGQSSQLPPVGQGYAIQSDADSYCLWRASRQDPTMTIYCETGAKCSDKEGVAAGSLPADCAHPTP